MTCGLLLLSLDPPLCTATFTILADCDCATMNTATITAVVHQKQGQIVNSPDRIRREMADQQHALEQERAEAMAAEKGAQRIELSAGAVARSEKVRNSCYYLQL
jgi:hypothetical protein